MIGQYQIYIMYVFTQIVPASHIIFPMLSWYHIYIIYGCIVIKSKKNKKKI